MSYSVRKRLIDYEDFVVLHISHSKRYHVQVKKGQVFQTTCGAVFYDNLVGKPFGTKFTTSIGKWLIVLYPTPELWTQVLPHRTQILYFADISLVIQQLNIVPGSVVIESGTGSGSLSHSILRAIGSAGHLYTFEFNANRVETAKREFEEHGLAQRVTVTHRDVCGGGFDGVLADGVKADAVFLDLPQPWTALAHALKHLRADGGRFCSFSPCIEQTQRFVDACAASGEGGASCCCVGVETVEQVHTSRAVRSHTFIPMADLGFAEDEADDTPSGLSVGRAQKNRVSRKPGAEYVSLEDPSGQATAHTGYLTFGSFFDLSR